MITRRGMLGAMLAAATAPAFVRYGSLMVPRVLVVTEVTPTVITVSPVEVTYVDQAQLEQTGIGMFTGSLYFKRRKEDQWQRLVKTFSQAEADSIIKGGAMMLSHRLGVTSPSGYTVMPGVVGG